MVEEQTNKPTEQAAQDAQIPNESPEEAAEDAELDQEEEKFPFPNARVVKIIKENFKKPHQVKRDVKVNANVLLGEILADIAQSMDNEEYFTLSIEHFNNAARKYKQIALNQKRINRIKKVLEKQRAELDEIIAEIDLEVSPE